MRIKFLAVIASFLCVSLTITSCLDDDTNYTYSSDANIQAFGLDTIHGKHYTFTIDQVNRLIFNRDSLPVGSDTIIDKILIDTMLVAGWVSTGVTDTLFNINDSVDLRPAMNNDTGMKFKVHAADGYSMREYTLKVNVHLQDPDLLAWTQMKDDLFTGMVNKGKQNAIVLNGNLWVYTSNTTAYSTSTLPTDYAWSPATVNGLPEDARLSTLVAHQGALYLTSADKQVYTSKNGTDWSAVSTLGNNVITLISGFTDRLTGIVEVDGKAYFNVTKDGLVWEGDNASLEAVPDGFPTERIASTLSHTGNGIEKVVLVGMPQASTQVTVPWFSLDGYKWADLANTTYNMSCPGLLNPFIMYYADKFYSFGDKLNTIYSSITGIAWEEADKKFQFPEALSYRGNFSVLMEPTTDKNAAPEERRDFIWVIFGGNGIPNEVWRGRLNKLGFIIQ